MSGRTVLAVLLVATLPRAQQNAPGPPVVLPRDWAERDLEGRWVAYRADLAAHPEDKDRGQRWAERLGALREYELLEWIGLYEGWRFAGPVLRAAGAPQTFRVALWNLAALDSHSKDNAQKALLEGGGQALGWFERHPQARRGRGAVVYEHLLARLLPADPGPMLPPLDPVQLLVPQLDVPAELAEFGDRLRAEGKVRYVHQVLRALDGVLVWGEADEMHAHKILALMRHGNATVRSAAANTLTRLPGELVPWEPLLRAVDREGDEAARKLAAMVLSFSAHPRAFYELHRLATAAGPIAEVALARLGDIGDAYTLTVLTAAMQTADGPLRQQLRTATEQIDGRLAAQDLAASPQVVRTYLERVAWLQNAADPRAGAAAAATAASLRQNLGAGLGPVLDAALAFTPPRSSLRGDERAAVERAMQAFADELKKAPPVR